MAEYAHLSEDQKRIRIVEDHANGEDINEIARRSGIPR